MMHVPILRSVAVLLVWLMAIAGGQAVRAADALECDTGLPASTMRLFDGHDHLRVESVEAGEDDLALLAAAGVSLGMLALGTPDADANSIARMLQTSSVHPVFTFAWAPTLVVDGVKVFSSTASSVVRGQLEAGGRGVGEMTLRHSGPPLLAADIAANDATAMEIYAEAAAHGVPVSIHFETRDKSAPGVDITSRIDELRAALSANPNTIFIWCHLGDTGPATVRALIEDFDNLYADLSSRNPHFVRDWPLSLQSLSDGGGSLKPEWKNLFEDYSDRFLFGLDLASDDRWAQLSTVVTYYREVLGQLSQETAEKIACKNANALLTIPSVPSSSGPWTAFLVLSVLVTGLLAGKRRLALSSAPR